MTVVDQGPGASTRPAIDSGAWPDIATVPHSTIRTAVARRIFRTAVRRIPLQVVEPDGHTYGGGSPSDPVMRLVRPASFFARVGASGTIGFGEAYMAGDWDADDLAGVLTAFAGNLRNLVPHGLQRLRHAVLDRLPSAHDNTVEGARANIHHHYDLSNELFSAFLDETLTYSSALFDGEPTHNKGDLASAQRRKVDRLLDAAGVGEGTRMLEIGTGWGELAIRAARRGATVTSLTISTEQAELARRRIDDEGLADRATVLLRDYRQADGSYDAVVSVEMIEAVGANHWDEYFATIDRLLLPNGRVGLQAILQDDDVVRTTGSTYTWIRKYIFPGGQIASVEAIQRVLAATSLRIADCYRFGRHYAETLRRWRERFEHNSDHVAKLGFDDTFRRMWSLYLAYSEADFRTGYLDVGQFTLTKPAR
ncbi:MAG TPA: cyclopropane-fatty-acyl-phospholipid synthase family protein [Jatrophihabitantaceae bacterium]|nr:cyclopropane-fatty-acyl-phospholipid synthase family protein [Jatrophihabitantaceae bacterium]